MTTKQSDNFLPALRTTGAAHQRPGLLQRAAVNSAPVPAVPSMVGDVLRSPGQALDAATRAYMEPRFGHDFSGVRVHTDDRAAESARAVQARAYTVGRDVVFGSGQYAPRGAEGRELLAHELAHVAQQAGSAPAGPLEVGAADDGRERAAEEAARGVARGNPAAPVRAAGGTALLLRAPDAGVPQSAPPQSQVPPGAGLRLGVEGDVALTLDGFETGKADLTAEHRRRLGEKAQEIRRRLPLHHNAFLIITGFTDAVGTDENNKQLGQRRAETVRQELAAAGIPLDLMHAGSLGESSLQVETQKPEPRNRRVEMTFHAGPSFALPLPQLGGAGSLPGPFPPLPGLTPLPGTPPSGQTPASAPKTPGPPGPAGDGSPTRAGGVGDVLKAITKLPEVDRRITEFAEARKRDWARLKPGEKAAAIGAAVTLGAGAVAGIASDPAARKMALGLLDGQSFPVPGVPGLTMKVQTQNGGGATLTFDLAAIIKPLK